VKHFNVNSSDICIVIPRLQIVGVHHWKHGRKGAGIAWLRRAQDDRRLAAVADELESVSLGMSGSQIETLQVRGLFLWVVLY
jgi:nuclear pore complex protein Nup85